MRNDSDLVLSFPAAVTPSLNGAAKPKNLIEIVRSFSYKMNAGNYESRDFFMSQKAECRSEDAEETSDKLYRFCRDQVLKSVKQYREEKLP